VSQGRFAGNKSAKAAGGGWQPVRPVALKCLKDGQAVLKGDPFSVAKIRQNEGFSSFFGCMWHKTGQGYK
jgi:hypothetical protein